MEAKKWHRSKTLWVNAIAFVAMLVQSQTGFVIDAETQVALLAVLNLVLRLVTRAPVGFVALLIVPFLAACATPIGFAGLGVEQIKAAAKIKDASIVCAKYDGLASSHQGRLVIASVDKGVEGSMAVSPDCAVIIDTTKREAK